MHFNLKNIQFQFIFLFILVYHINYAQVKSNIDSLFYGFTNDLPGLSYVVIKNGVFLENQNYGLSDLDKQQKSTNETNYRLASVTKQFTALAILMLIDHEKLYFSSTLTDVFDDFPKYGKNITIQQLLTHTSGLLDYENLMKDNRKEPILDNEVLQLMKQQDSTKFIPGSKYDYSNSAYAVLSQIVKIISGKSYKEFVETEIFKPLKMKNSIVYTKDSQIRNRAFGYSILKDSIIFNDQSMTSSVQGDGGIYTSINDYFKWNQALEKDQLISSQLKEKTYSIQSKNPDSEWSYGYGWRIKYDGNTKIISHSGHTVGFTNYVVKIPEQKLSVVLFSNRNNDDSVIEIGNKLLKKYEN